MDRTGLESIVFAKQEQFTLSSWNRTVGVMMTCLVVPSAFIIFAGYHFMSFSTTPFDAMSFIVFLEHSEHQVATPSSRTYFL